jgi:hypothetical protein
MLFRYSKSTEFKIMSDVSYTLCSTTGQMAHYHILRRLISDLALGCSFTQLTKSGSYL